MKMIDYEKIKRLNKYIDKLQQGSVSGIAAKDLYMENKIDLMSVTPQEAFEIFTNRYKAGQSSSEILNYLDKVINVFHHGLVAYKWRKPMTGSFLHLLSLENRKLVERLDAISEKIQDFPIVKQKESLLEDVTRLLEFNDHYLKKENIIFPLMEKKHSRFDGLAIMWSLHDEARQKIKETIEFLEKETLDEGEEPALNIVFGELFFAMHGIVQKEELILFPTMVEIFNHQEMEEMLRQSYEYSFPFLEKNEIPPEPDGIKSDFSVINNYLIKTETGNITLEQLMLIFSSLPVDLSFVDENNKLCFFSRPKDRIFPRSQASLGRDVANCHPPESVHVVQEIIESFRSGKQNKASFWIEIKEKFILIQYFALRNEKDEYRGVLEVSQDITDIRKLEGQRRLLNWDDLL